MRLVTLELVPRAKTLYYLVLFSSIALFILGAYIALHISSHIERGGEIVVSTAVLGALLLYYFFLLRTNLRRYRVYRELLSSVVLEGDRVKLPVNNFIVVETRIWRTVYKRGYRASISVKRLEERTSNEIEVIGNSDYRFIADTYRGYIREVEYIGKAYAFTYEGLEFIAIPLPVYRPSISIGHLRVSSDGDSGEAYLDLRDNKLNAKLYYRKTESDKLKLELVVEDTALYLHRSETLAVIEENGSRDYVVELPMLVDNHVLIMPLSHVFFEDAVLRQDDLLYTGEGFGDRVKLLVLGYRGVGLRLKLDMPLRRDIVSDKALFKPVVIEEN